MNKKRCERNVGDELCFDSFSGRPFWSTINAIERELLRPPFCVEAMSLNDFYDELFGMIDGNELDIIDVKYF